MMAIPRGLEAGTKTTVSSLPTGPLTNDLCSIDVFKSIYLMKVDAAKFKFLDVQQYGR